MAARRLLILSTLLLLFIASACEDRRADKAYLRGDYDKAHSELNSALQQPSITNDQKYNILFQQGITYENQGMHQQAIDSYKQAAQIKENNETRLCREDS